MSYTAEAVAQELTGIVKELVHAAPEITVKARLRAVARHIGIPFGRAQNYLYSEIRCPPAHEADQIRAYYESAKQLIEAKNAYENARQEFLGRHPMLGRFAPRSIARSELLAEAEAVASSKLAPSRR